MITIGKKFKTVVLSMSVLAMSSVVSLSAQALVATAETKAVVEILTNQVAKSNSNVRAALLTGAKGTETVTMAIRGALKLNATQKLTLDAGQVEKLKAIMLDPTNTSIQKTYIAEGLVKMQTALGEAGLASAAVTPENQAKYALALGKDFKAISASNTGAQSQSTETTNTSAQNLSMVELLSLTSSITVNMENAIKRCADGSCELTYQTGDMDTVKKGFVNQYARKFINKAASCFKDWKSSNALSSLAGGAIALQSELAELDANGGPTTQNVKTAEEAFLRGAADANLKLKASPNFPAAFKKVCAALIESPCNLFAQTDACPAM